MRHTGNTGYNVSHRVRTAPVKEYADRTEYNYADKRREYHCQNNFPNMFVDVVRLTERDHHAADGAVIRKHRCVNAGILLPRYYIVRTIIQPLSDYDFLIDVIRCFRICVLPSDRGSINRRNCSDVIIKYSVVQSGTLLQSADELPLECMLAFPEDVVFIQIPLALKHALDFIRHLDCTNRKFFFDEVLIDAGNLKRSNRNQNRRYCNTCHNRYRNDMQHQFSFSLLSHLVLFLSLYWSKNIHEILYHSLEKMH